MYEKMKVDIIGQGNVGSHLAKALQSAADVAVVNPRSLEGLRPDSDLYIISVSDSAISEVFGRIISLLPPQASGIVAHTSGSTDISALSQQRLRFGVFYPLQTFSKDVALEYDKIPVLIDGCDEETSEKLETLAAQFSSKVRRAGSAERRKLHLASVLACNFANRLWSIADEYLSEENLDFELLKPLIAETCRKMMVTRHPAEGQTGPAVRHDLPTIDKHLDMLSSRPALRQIYSIMTESIMAAATVGQPK